MRTKPLANTKRNEKKIYKNPNEGKHNSQTEVLEHKNMVITKEGKNSTGSTED
jgi:hypothetical protein